MAYTVKGHGTPLAGHKDNHSGMMNPAQMEQFRAAMGFSEGEEWEPWGGLGDNAATQLKAFIAESPLTRKSPEPVARAVAVPAVAAPDGAEQSTQAAFGRILLDLAKSGDELADRDRKSTRLNSSH